MDKINNNDEIEIDLQRLFKALLNKSWLIGVVAVVCAVVTFLGTFFFVTPKYQSDVLFYVNNNSITAGDLDLSITSSDISAAQSLVDTYIVILNTRDLLNDVIDYAGVDRTYSEIKSMIEAESVNGTEIFQVVVTSEDPVEAEKIADAIAYILPKRITTIIENTNTKVADSAVRATAPSSPSYTKDTLIGFLVGLVIMAALIILHELVDTTIRTEEDIAQICKHPVLVAVPDMESHAKGGYYYGYGNRKKANVKTEAKENVQPEVLGANINFAASEAYKLLRTKLQFSFADESACRVIGVSSALTGEGKSLSAVNLAYSLSELGMRVLLVECDMRRPSLYRKLPILKTPGLSDYLTGQTHAEMVLQPCGIQNEENAFHVISSGATPPNPMELLSSARMEKLVARLRENYDYVILDLPPVGEVGDALATAKLTDGMLLVVRQNWCDRNSLSATIRQFEFVNTKIIGVVFNGATEEGGKYGSRGYTKRYQKYYTKNNYSAAAKKRFGK